MAAGCPASAASPVCHGSERNALFVHKRQTRCAAQAYPPPELDFTDASFYEALDTRGLSVVHASRKLEVVIPPAEVAAGPGITPFEPAAFISSRGYTQGGQVIEYTESHYPASRSSFRIEINR